MDETNIRDKLVQQLGLLVLANVEQAVIIEQLKAEIEKLKQEKKNE